MRNPFIVRDSKIDERIIHDTINSRWVEDVVPARSNEIEYLKPSLQRKRFWYFAGGFIFILLFFLGRSAQLQIINGSEFQAAAEANRLRILRLRAPRGAIVDRNGIDLTKNIPHFQVLLTPSDLPTDAALKMSEVEKIAAILSLSLDELTLLLDSKEPDSAPRLIKDGLTPEEAFPVILASQDLPGLAIETIATRFYPFGASFAHLLGYLGKIDEQEKKYYLENGYSLNDIVGKSGLEKTFENILHGKDGKQYTEVDASGRRRSTKFSEEASQGSTLTLSIDAPLQIKTTESLQQTLNNFKKTRGAAIVLNPQSGEILALVSLPSFDNNIFTLGKDIGPVLNELNTNPNQPLFPRATAGTYPSGSIIKPAIAAAALQEGIITPLTTILSVGGIRIGEWFFPDWKSGGHGPVSVTRAIAESVNTFFYAIGGGWATQKGLGINRLAEYLRKFGFGKSVGIELAGEADGFVPNTEWKERIKNEPWYIGDTYHLSIGQGDFLVTPLQIARMTAYFASNGKWTKPHLSLSLCHPSQREGSRDSLACGLRMTETGPGISPQHIQTVRRGMREAVLYGSARSLLALPIDSAGKTGTAQWSNSKSPHAWFMGWAPFNNPQIAVTVLIEEGEEGSRTAVAAAKEIIRAWYENKSNISSIINK
ncbi:MAG: Penicillin-binding protein 2 [Parcubacteria group bacterium GW2011_GWA2_47_26]|nr:MAG: Penicillin-binding protein 2 [Parcubacteria group bacterium GW2011_GWA2_47_26]